MSEETGKLFRTLLKELRPLFKENGFQRSSQNFILESAECWVIINFQKSRWASRDETTFYVNVAACSKRWLGVEGKPADNVPAYYSCDWQWRVEYFGRDKNVQKWTLRDKKSLEDTLAYLRNLLIDFVFPATKTMTSEDELVKHSGGYEYLQLKTRAMIFAATNQVDALQDTIATLIEKFSSGPVAEITRQHLEMLRSKHPTTMSNVEWDQR